MTELAESLLINRLLNTCYDYAEDYFKDYLKDRFRWQTHDHEEEVPTAGGKPEKHQPRRQPEQHRISGLFPFLILFSYCAFRTSIIDYIAGWCVHTIMVNIIAACSDYIAEQVGRQTGLKKVLERLKKVLERLKKVHDSDESGLGDSRRPFDSDEQEDDEDNESAGSEGAGEGLERAAMEGETSDGAGSFSTFFDDDSSSSATKFVISPNGRFKKKIKSWMRGNHLGSGAFGTVYEGICDDGTFVAVKEVSLLDTGNKAKKCILQLEQEIELLSQLEHENIVQYYGTDKEESKLFIFLEHVPKGSVVSVYKEYPLHDTQVSSYTRQILNGLNYLHERNVVHRDIKCANILVHANGSIKLADFGVAKMISKFNELKSFVGSVYWMAPEVIHPEKTYGCAADIWSLGCTVLEMLTRQIPYPNMEQQQAAFKILLGNQPNVPSDLSSDAQDFIRRCVQVDPNARPTAVQLLEHPFVTRRPLNHSTFGDLGIGCPFISCYTSMRDPT